MMSRIKTNFSMRPILFALVILGVILAGVQSFIPCRSDEDYRVRIAILKNVNEVRITVQGGYSLIDPVKQIEIRGGRRLATIVVPSAKGLVMEGEEIPVSRVKLIPRFDVSVVVGGHARRYRGEIDIIKTPDNKILVTNTLGLEEYIQGVLYHEISPRWPLDAIMAQAVASRSYAVYQILHNKAKDFDVSSDIYSQVYGGRSSEKYRTNLGVAKTKGQVLVYKGEILPAYFHATCAGTTEDVRELWKHDELPPLSGSRCNFCYFSPHSRWKKNMQLSAIQGLLNKNGYNLDLIKDIAVVQKNASGRVKTLKVTTRKGIEVTVPGKDFRQIVGPNAIRSNKYRVVMKGYYCDFIGEGWGHGVGLCQWGALGMARLRYDYRAILARYYPGSEIMDIGRLNPVVTKPAAAPDNL